MTAATVMFLLFGWPLGYILPAAMLLVTLARPRSLDLGWSRTLPVAFAGWLFYALAEAVTGRWRGALVDAGALFLTLLIAYAVFAALADGPRP